MIIFKYIIAIIALFSTLIFITNIISDIVMPNSIKAINLNMSEEDLTKKSSFLKLVLMIIISITWPILFIF